MKFYISFKPSSNLTSKKLTYQLQIFIFVNIDNFIKLVTKRIWNLLKHAWLEGTPPKIPETCQ